jgi:Tfp pilus assembly protein PilN
VRAVNLLPAKHRPRAASGERQGSSYYVLGALGVLLIAVVAYVLTVDSINSKRDGVAKANAEAAQYQADSGALSAYGDFAQVKQQRVRSIEQLAQGRVDWELLVRELSQVLPDGTWLSTVNATTNDANSQAGTSGSSSPSSSASSSSTGSGAPSVQLQGCAESQELVATLLVRLRQLEGAQDVNLDKSDRPDDITGGATPSSTSGGDCGVTHGQPNYSFSVTVTLSPTVAQDSSGVKVPASLGGGS